MLLLNIRVGRKFCNEFTTYLEVQHTISASVANSNVVCRLKPSRIQILPR